MKIIGMSLTHNDESKGWLKEWLVENSVFLNKWVILDDCSDDNTYEYIQQFIEADKRDISLVKTEEPTFKVNENKIRNMLWEEVRKVAKEGDWIICLDSDEILCKEFEVLKTKLLNKKVDSHIIDFKKVEMWNETQYRNDGLWSNYFSRMFKFEDKEWGFYEEGFHHPQIPKYCFEKKGLSYQSNCRIKHLAYMTEELRNAKYDFMMNNKQQKKDVTYYHLQTISDKEIELVGFKDEIEDKKVCLVFVCDNLHSIPNELFESIKYMKYNKKNIGYMWLVNNCSLELIEQIEKFEPEEALFNEFLLFNYQEDDWNNMINRKSLVLKKEFLQYLKKKNIDVDYVAFIDPLIKLHTDAIQHFMVCDKPIMYLRAVQTLPLLFVRYEMLFDKRLDSWGNARLQYENEEFAMLFSNDTLLWNCYYGSPFPINSHIIANNCLK